MTSAFLTPQNLRPFPPGAERQQSVNTKSNIRINPAPSRRVASFHKYAGRKLFPYDELELQRQVEAANGKWNVQQKVWELPYREVLELGLADYLVETGTADGECF